MPEECTVGGRDEKVTGIHRRRICKKDRRCI